MENAMIQKLLKSVQDVQASIDGRLAVLESFYEEAGIGKDGPNVLQEVKSLRHTVEELKALIRSGAFNSDGGSAVDSIVKAVGFTDERMCKAFGLYILGTLGGRGKSLSMLGDMGGVYKAMAEGVNSTGGALVPEEFVRQLINLAFQYGVFRRNARVIPMASDKQIWPKIDTDVTIYAPGEAGAITASNPTFEDVTLSPTKLAALCAISSELDEDSAIAVGMLVGESIARSMAKAEDQIGFLGDGTSTYYGMTGITGALRAVDGTIGNIKSLVVGSGNQYSELALADFDKVVANYPDDYDIPGQTAWYMHRYFYWTVVRPLIQAYSSGKPTVGDALDTESGGRFILRGYPVIFTSVMPKVEANSQICALFGNLRWGVYLGDRRQLRIDRSREVYFTTDQVGIRGTERIAINAFGVGDTTDPGPVMGLITAAG